MTVSDMVVCSTGDRALSPFLFSLYTSDFYYNSVGCHLQTFTHDTAIVGCVSGGDDQEYREVIRDFVNRCELNHLQLNASKTKELVIDFRLHWWTSRDWTSRWWRPTNTWVFTSTISWTGHIYTGIIQESFMQWSAGEGGAQRGTGRDWTNWSGGLLLSWTVLWTLLRMLAKLTSIMDDPSHPLHDTVGALSNRLRLPPCKKERYRRSFIPTAIRLFNTSL